MAYPDLLQADLKIVGVLDAGVPNAERIAIKPNRQVWLAGVGIAVLGVGIADRTRQRRGKTARASVVWFLALADGERSREHRRG